MLNLNFLNGCKKSSTTNQLHVQYNWIFPWGPFFGASHSSTQFAIKARNSAQRAGWLLTAGFRNSAVPSHCCWQEVFARRWCAEQELIWSGLLQLKGIGPEVMHDGKCGDDFSHSFLQFMFKSRAERLCWMLIFINCSLLIGFTSFWAISVNNSISAFASCCNHKKTSREHFPCFS